MRLELQEAVTLPLSGEAPTETVWKIVGGLLDCGHGWCTGSKIAVLGLLLPDCTAPVEDLSEFPDSLSRHFGEYVQEEGPRRYAPALAPP